MYRDVPANHPYALSIGKATALGLISGDAGRDTYRPDEPINRAEAAQILMMIMELPDLEQFQLRRAAP
jgi:hypothetical protein